MATDETPEVLFPAFWGVGEEAAKGEVLLKNVREGLNDPTISSASIEPWLNSGGNAGDMFRLTIKKEDDTSEGTTEKVLCAKFTKADTSTSLANGLAREGVFLSNLPEALASLVPHTALAVGHLPSGRKLIIADHISGAQCGYFFSDHSPLNKAKDLTALTASFPGVTEKDVCLEVARMAAKLHASMWNDEGLKAADPPVPMNVLRAREWLLHGEQREAWEGSMAFARGAWETTKAKPQSEREGLVLSPEVTALFDAAFEKATWEELQGGLAKRDYTLVHGDFHPANMIVTAPPAGSDKPFSIKLVDWELVGVGCGPQDLGQFMLSHSTPTSRREIEPELLAVYTEALNAHLTAAGKPLVDADVIKERYVQGGLGRFGWMAPVIMRFLPPAFAMYFVVQVQAFADDHGITPETMPAARA